MKIRWPYVGAAAVGGVLVVAVQVAWHVLHLHRYPIDWGDAPTWLAVAVAAIGGTLALIQYTGQTHELERQQAKQLGVSWTPDAIGSYVDIRNGSPRPIRNVACRIGNASAALFIGPSEVVRLIEVSIGGVTGMAESIGAFGSRSPWIAANGSARFRFATVPHDVYDGHRLKVHFTDDAELHWQLDGNLILTKLRRRDW